MASTATPCTPGSSGGSCIPSAPPGVAGGTAGTGSSGSSPWSPSQSRPRTVLYARVSTRKQEPFLQAQVARLEAFAREQGWDCEVVAEVASGVNENRGAEPGQEG